MKYAVRFNHPESASLDFEVEREADTVWQAIAQARADYPAESKWRVTACSAEPREAASCDL